MIWIDFNVICIGQNKKTIPCDIKDIVIDAYKRTKRSRPFYISSYNFQTADKLLGSWYSIRLQDDICYDESLFDISPDDIPYVMVVPKWLELVKKVLLFYLNASPVNKIAVLLRVQDKSDDTINREYSLDEFVQALIAGKIKWNELYYVSR